MSLTVIIVVITCIISFLAFQNRDLMEKLMMKPYAVNQHNEFYRFISSGFVHANWWHLGINMFVFWMFGRFVEQYYGLLFGELGNILFLVLYLLGIILSDTYTYFQEKNNPGYRGLGASGAVAAVLFAFIIFNPWEMLYIWGIIPIPAVIAGVLYLIYEYTESKKSGGRINHHAHFFGALFGLIFTFILQPSLLPDFFQQLINIPFFK